MPEQSLFPSPERTDERPLLAAVEFEYLPSINDVLAVSRQKFGISTLIRKWLLIAEEKVCRIAKVRGIETEVYVEWVYAGKDRDGNRKTKPVNRERLKTVLLTQPLDIEIHVWRPDSRRTDVHNIFHKSVLDGFVAARLFRVDDTTQVKSLKMVYEGINRDLALTKIERTVRANENALRVARGRKPKRQSARARFRFEFYEAHDEHI